MSFSPQVHRLGAVFRFKAIEEGNLLQILVLRLETEQNQMMISEHWLHKMELSVPAIMLERPQDFVNLMEFIILKYLKKNLMFLYTLELHAGFWAFD